MSLRPSALLALAATTLALAACGSDGGDARTPAETHVAFLYDSAYVQIDTTDTGAEGSNLVLAFEGAGFGVVRITVFDSASVATALSGADLFVVPEQEMGALTGAPAPALDLLKSWVLNGGRLLLIGDDGANAADLLNTEFGFHVASACCLDEAGFSHRLASVSPFAGGPDSLANEDATTYLFADSLPVGSKLVYGNADSITVAVLPAGAGRVAYFGWDWYNGKPNGAAGAGWLTLIPDLARF